jgi:hypothetical protein
MKQSATRYAGLSAAFVLGVGLLIVGKTLAGIGVLGMSVYFLGMALSSERSTKAFLTTVVAIIWSGVLAYQATTNEITGQAMYWHGLGISSSREPVTREGSPAKFRVATNLKWALSIVCASVGVGAFVFYRKSEDADDFI